MEKIRNRWLIALSAVGIHIAIGSVYAWSVYTQPLVDQMGWGLADTQLTFSLAIFFLGISPAFLGKFIEKIGPQKAGMLSALFFGMGIMGSGLAVQLNSIYLLYVCYGILGGIGLGIGYIAPVATLLKWFPDKRGLASGIAIMGFGFAALISSPVIVYLISEVDISGAFYITGAVYFIIIFISSLYLSPPPTGWEPLGFRKNEISPNSKSFIAVRDLSGSEALRTRKFWFLWVMFFINISCGIAIISAASPMAQEYAGLSAVSAAAMVGFMGLFNGMGRIGWASLSDLTGRPGMFSIFFAIQIVAYLLLTTVSNPYLFQVLIFIIISCYGGGFATLPAFLGDVFGTKNLGIILGYILTAWAAAGLAGPLFAAWTRSVTSSYDETLYVFSGLLVVALMISFLMWGRSGKWREESG